MTETEQLTSNDHLLNLLQFPLSNKKQFIPFANHIIEIDRERALSMVSKLPKLKAHFHFPYAARIMRQSILKRLMKSIIGIKIAEIALPEFEKEFLMKYNQAADAYGLRVGSLASEAMSQPIAQGTLKSFQSSGSKTSVSNDIETFADILQASKDPIRQKSTLFFRKPITYEQFVLEYVPDLMKTTFGDLVARQSETREWFQSTPLYKTFEYDPEWIEANPWYKTFFLFFPGVETEVSNTQYGVRFYIDPLALYEAKLTMGGLARKMNEQTKNERITFVYSPLLRPRKVDGKDYYFLDIFFPTEYLSLFNTEIKMIRKKSKTGGVKETEAMKNNKAYILSSSGIVFLWVTFEKIELRGYTNLSNPLPIVNDIHPFIHLEQKLFVEGTTVISGWNIRLNIIGMHTHGIKLSKMVKLIEMTGYTIERAQKNLIIARLSDEDMEVYRESRKRMEDNSKLKALEIALIDILGNTSEPTKVQKERDNLFIRNIKHWREILTFTKKNFHGKKGIWGIGLSSFNTQIIVAIEKLVDIYLAYPDINLTKYKISALNEFVKNFTKNVKSKSYITILNERKNIWMREIEQLKNGISENGLYKRQIKDLHIVTDAILEVIPEENRNTYHVAFDKLLSYIIELQKFDYNNNISTLKYQQGLENGELESAKNDFTTIDSEPSKRIQAILDKETKIRTDMINNDDKFHQLTDYENAAKFIYCQCKGSNLKDMVKDDRIDMTRSFSGKIMEMNELFGMEAARTYLVGEFSKSSANSYFDMRNIKLITSYMTNKRKISAINYKGLENQVTGDYSRMALSKVMENLQRGTAFGTTESAGTVAVNNLVGGNLNTFRMRALDALLVDDKLNMPVRYKRRRENENSLDLLDLL